jgi:hypothetical protein
MVVSVFLTQTDFSFAVSPTTLEIDRLNTGIKYDSFAKG